MSAHASLSAGHALGAQRAALANARAKRASGPSTTRSVTIRAFWKKEPPAPPPPPPPEPKGLAKLFGKKSAAAPPPANVRDVEYVYQESMSDAYARVKKQREITKKKFEAKEKGGLSLFMFNALSAVNFEEDIEADRGLLAQAKRMGKGDKMSREQYGALQRKVGGTKGGLFRRKHLRQRRVPRQRIRRNRRRAARGGGGETLPRARARGGARHDRLRRAAGGQRGRDLRRFLFTEGVEVVVERRVVVLRIKDDLRRLSSRRSFAHAAAPDVGKDAFFAPGGVGGGFGASAASKDGLCPSTDTPAAPP
jgi:hypothetical protein